jgi:hypothetical protein
LNPDLVTAVLVTRGNVDLDPIIDSLIFEKVIVWNNQTSEPDEMTYGRACALAFVPTELVYSQDDDIIHTPENQQAIIDAYQPGVLTGCMWDEWSDGARRQGIEDGYEDLAFAGSGSVYDRDLPGKAAARYLEHFPLDDFFRLWADTIIGIIAPSAHLDIRFEALPSAEDDYRMCNLPDGVEQKTEAIERARWVRSHHKPDAHAVYMREALAGRIAEHRYL